MLRIYRVSGNKVFVFLEPKCFSFRKHFYQIIFAIKYFLRVRPDWIEKDFDSRKEFDSNKWILMPKWSKNGPQMDQNEPKWAKMAKINQNWPFDSKMFSNQIVFNQNRPDSQTNNLIAKKQFWLELFFLKENTIRLQKTKTLFPAALYEKCLFQKVL